jgi:Sigma-70 region 3
MLRVVLRPELLTVAQALLEVRADVFSLDHVAEAIGTRRVTPDEIEELLDWLETQGRSVGDPVGRGAAELLAEVLGIARSLRAELGRAPQPREIAERGSLTIEAVQRALWFARILQR